MELPSLAIDLEILYNMLCASALPRELYKHSLLNEARAMQIPNTNDDDDDDAHNANTSYPGFAIGYDDA
jgi:hypothetical protein